MKECLFYIKKEDYVICLLCPKTCRIKNNEVGFCGVRKNINGKLISLVYNRPIAINIDPMEKKPLYHFYPNEKILSIGTYGCNLDCLNCQNYDITHVKFDFSLCYNLNSEDIINIAKKNNLKFIAYTYNEPTVFFEYMLDIAKLAKENGIKNVMVTNGYINNKPLKMLIEYIDAFNVDVKSFNEETYEKLTTGSLRFVLETIKTIKSHNKWLELTWLVVPNFSNNENEFESFISWLSDLDRYIPLHISRFFPMYKLVNSYPTPIETLERFYKIAKRKLAYVYLGNVYEKQDTYCYQCGKKVIERKGYYIKNLLVNGKCPFCNTRIHGFF